MIAEAKMKGQMPGHTLQATILVDDAWQKLVGNNKDKKFEGKEHFYKAASEVMRCELVDHARRKNAQKRGIRVDIPESKFISIKQEAPDELILAVDEALNAFSKVDEKIAKLLELRFFVGLSMQEAADCLGIPLRTAERNFAYFKAWFRSNYGRSIFD